MREIERYLLPLVSAFLLTEAALAADFCCTCTLISDDKTLVSRFEVKTPMEIQCDDYNGINVPLENPDPGPMRAPGIFAELAGCKVCPQAPASSKYKRRDFPFLYNVQPEDANRPRPYNQP